MKKKLALFIFILLISLQPLSFNGNLGLAKEIQYSSTENCNECAKKDILTLEKTGKISNQKVINNVKESLRNAGEFKESIYKQSDFDWNNGEFLDYGENKNGLIVSYKKNDENIDIRLLTAYDNTTYEVSEILIMKSVAEGSQFKTSYTNLNGEEFVNFTTDMKTSQIIDVETAQEETNTSLLTINKASANYFSKVGNCIISYWNNASWFTQTFCTGACGSVIFGGNAFGVAMCASCLGASALSCLISQA
jgi:hypothetical protein